jgi:hypothetical protein
MNTLELKSLAIFKALWIPSIFTFIPNDKFFSHDAERIPAKLMI